MSCIAWLISLALPGFIIYSRAEAWYGGEILLFGLIFGWLVHGWAAYANIAFFYVAVKLLSGQRPYRSVLALLGLVATLPFFKGVIEDEGSGAALPVVSWGWGAVVWIYSLALLAMASAIQARLLSLREARRLLGLLSVGLVAIVGLHFYQRSHANTQEQDLYLSSGTAFTLASPCGVPLTTVSGPLLPPDAIVTLDISPDLLKPSTGVPYLQLPTLPNYQDTEFAWATFNDPIVSGVKVRVRTPARPDRPILQIRKSKEGAVLRLLGSRSGPVLYEQTLKITSANGARQYCPMSTNFGISGLRVGYDTMLLQALGKKPNPTPPSREKLSEEVARLSCDLGANDKGGMKGLRDWDGREVILQPEFLRSKRGFCSDSYIVLVYISEDSAGPIPAAQVFDRKTLRPLATFNSRRTCPKEGCQEAPREFATGARISDLELVVETTDGDLIAKRQ